MLTKERALQMIKQRAKLGRSKDLYFCETLRTDEEYDWEEEDRIVNAIIQGRRMRGQLM